MVQALDQFGLDSSGLSRYRLVEVSLEKGCKKCFLKFRFSILTKMIFYSCTWAHHGQQWKPLGKHKGSCKSKYSIHCAYTFHLELLLIGIDQTKRKHSVLFTASGRSLLFERGHFCWKPSTELIPETLWKDSCWTFRKAYVLHNSKLLFDIQFDFSHWQRTNIVKLVQYIMSMARWLSPMIMRTSRLKLTTCLGKVCLKRRICWLCCCQTLCHRWFPKEFGSVVCSFAIVKQRLN